MKPTTIPMPKRNWEKEIKMEKSPLEEYPSMATVKGFSWSGKQLSFTLTMPEIKHIRRCLKLFVWIHPPIYVEEIQQILTKKFGLFGGRNYNRINNIHKKRIREQLPQKCASCGTNKKLSVDHITQLSEGGSNDISNLQMLCIKCHNIKNLKHRIQIKQKEIKVLKKRMENVPKTRIQNIEEVIGSTTK